MRASLVTLLSLLLLILSSSCACGELVFFDPFEPADGPANEQPESLHTYASDATVPMRVRTTDPFLDVETLTPSTSGELELDPEAEIELDGGALSFVLLTRGAGTGTIALLDESGASRGTRELTIVDAEELTLSVTSPEAEGIALPSVDPGNLRVFQGGSAGFRTTLLADGEEVFGTRAVEPTPSHEDVGGRRATACSRDGCGSPRSAVVLSVAADAADPTPVTLTAGSASLTVTVVPTTEAEVTSLEADGPVDDPHNAEQRVLAALPMAGSEPVFGAPVAWTVDDTALEDRGDLLRFTAGEGSASVTATLGALEEAFTLDIAVEEPGVTSITAACGQTGQGTSAAAPVLALLLLLRLRYRRRR